MKYILLFILVVFFSCKELKTTNKKASPRFYNVILNEIEQVDTSLYYITYQIIKDIENLDEFQYVLDKQEQQNNFIIDSIDVNLNLSKKNLKIISESLINKEKKIELNYMFSHPYLLKDSTVLIFNQGTYKLRNMVKGGASRAIYLKKNNGKYTIDKTVGLVDY